LRDPDFRPYLPPSHVIYNQPKAGLLTKRLAGNQLFENWLQTHHKDFIISIHFESNQYKCMLTEWTDNKVGRVSENTGKAKTNLSNRLLC